MKKMSSEFSDSQPRMERVSDAYPGSILAIEEIRHSFGNERHQGTSPTMNHEPVSSFTHHTVPVP